VRSVGRKARQPDESEDNVAHGEAGPRDTVAAYVSDQIVVTPSAEHGAVLAGCVACLEDDTGVVVQPADDRRIIGQVVGHAEGLGGVEKLDQLRRVLPRLPVGKDGLQAGEPIGVQADLQSVRSPAAADIFSFGRSGGRLQRLWRRFAELTLASWRHCQDADGVGPRPTARKNAADGCDLRAGGTHADQIDVH
jgi:hypothetical protein